VLAIDVKGNLAATLAAASPGEDWQRRLTVGEAENNYPAAASNVSGSGSNA
jgi:hypothetical protein